MSDAVPLGGAGPAGAAASVHSERVLAGRYRLKRLIAKGGMAEVWEAVDEILGRPVAVKILHPHLAADESFRERFRREAISAARLAHPNVVATFDTGTDTGITFIVMELVDSPTLRQALNDGGPMAPAQVVHIGAQVADALHYAHKAGVVHRDIKPANILICPDGRVKVADFGIAKAVEDSEVSHPSPSEALTGTGTIVGTAQYLSPEQVDGRAVDGRADVYALGVVLYEMLCGRPPFTGETDMAVALKHITTDPLSPRQVKAGIPPALEQVVLRALAKAPEARYQSAADLQTALLSVDPDGREAVARPVDVGAPTGVVAAPPMPRPRQDHTPPRGVPPSFVQSERKWMVPTVAIVAVALTLGIIGVLFARSDTGQRLLDDVSAGDGPSAGQANAIPRPTPLAFDPPPGSGVEHDDELPFLVDGDASSVWRTENYASSRFGGLKPGVGVILRLDGPHQLKELKMTSPTKGWSAEVLVADAPRTTRDAWGTPVATKRGIGDGSTTFDLGDRTGGAILLWITDLGDGNSAVSIGELSVA
ncbi:MAG: protein kinase [Actinomycetota bacterium]|nr:protein kinase [Actinomycetota bacterium]